VESETLFGELNHWIGSLLMSRRIRLSGLFPFRIISETTKLIDSRVKLLVWGISPVARSLPTHRATQTQNKRRQTSMPRAGFEPMIPVFERAKTFRSSDRAAIMIVYKTFEIEYLFNGISV
jgi:hypothetical protein